ncbi:MAG: ribulose-phosphate 3-epimerase [Thermoleophilia bacterium]|nr:ribulose-phosphate 3-epimerase [Actinomycetota bacterium]
MTLPAELLQQRLLAPSILSADFSRLGEEVATVLAAGVRLIHVDVMDGHFVPNITIGPPVVASLAPLVHEAGAFVDAHLMINEPDRYLEAFGRAGADGLSVHVEACPHLHRTLTRIRELGMRAGVALNPATDLALLGEAVLFCDYVLVMSVNPGFGGQTFIPESLDKIRRLRALLPAQAALEVDGGVDRGNIVRLRDAGANWFVAGSAVFGGGDARVQVSVLQELIAGAA